MKLRYSQFQKHLQKGPLAPLYLLMGEEPFQLREGVDQVRTHARARGFTERIVLTVETGFDWNTFGQATQNLSLFARKRLIELQLGEKSPDKVGTTALIDYATQPSPATLLLVTATKVDAKNKWLPLFEEKGVVVQISPLAAKDLPSWIYEQMIARGLQPSEDAVQLLAERSEGHLLACAQEIEKLRLIYGTGAITATQVLETVADSARFDLFQWIDTVVSGDGVRSLRQLQQLRMEGYEPVLVLWALTREIRNLCQLSQAMAKGQTQEQVFKAYHVWQNRKSLIASALNRYSVTDWYQFLRWAVRIDSMTKGMAPGRPWDEILQLSLRVAGVHLPLTTEL